LASREADRPSPRRHKSSQKRTRRWSRAFNNAPARLQSTIALGMAGSPQGAEKSCSKPSPLGKAVRRRLFARSRPFVPQAAASQSRQARRPPRRAHEGPSRPRSKVARLARPPRKERLSRPGKWDAASGQAIFPKNNLLRRLSPDRQTKARRSARNSTASAPRGVDRLPRRLARSESQRRSSVPHDKRLELDKRPIPIGTFAARGRLKYSSSPNAQGKGTCAWQKKNVLNRNIGPLSPIAGRISGSRIPEEDFPPPGWRYFAEPAAEELEPHTAKRLVHHARSFGNEV